MVNDHLTFCMYCGGDDISFQFELSASMYTDINITCNDCNMSKSFDKKKYLALYSPPMLNQYIQNKGGSNTLNTGS